MASPLDAYLRDLQLRLRALPAARREEEITEVRLHLQALYEDGIRHGLTEEKAAELAVRRFGAPDRVGRDLVASWKRQFVMAPVCRRWGLSAALLGVYYLLINVLPGISRTITSLPLASYHALAATVLNIAAPFGFIIGGLAVALRRWWAREALVLSCVAALGLVADRLITLLQVSLRGTNLAGVMFASVVEVGYCLALLWNVTLARRDKQPPLWQTALLIVLIGFATTSAALAGDPTAGITLQPVAAHRVHVHRAGSHRSLVQGGRANG